MLVTVKSGETVDVTGAGDDGGVTWIEVIVGIWFNDQLLAHVSEKYMDGIVGMGTGT